MKEIQIYGGHTLRIDDQDYNLVSQYQWHLIKIGGKATVMTNRRIGNGNKERIRLYHLILDAPKYSFSISYQDGDPLNNQRNNLIAASRSKRAGAELHSGTPVRAEVYWRKRLGAWCARVRILNKAHHVGYFNEEGAAIQACEEAIKRWQSDSNATDFKSHQLRPFKRANKTGFIGVYQNADGAFSASICVNGKLEHLGRYPTAKRAAIVRDQKAIEVHGARARLNFPDEHPVKTSASSSSEPASPSDPAQPPIHRSNSASLSTQQ